MHIVYSLLIPLFIFSFPSGAQTKEFPQCWQGNWKGELHWYKGAASESQNVLMELRIRPSDSAGKYSWQIIYGSESKDNRPYTLIVKDEAKGHWAIDENNGIVLDQYWVGDKFCGLFTVGNSTIFNSYWMEGGNLIAEYYSMRATPLATTGNGTEESPKVDSYSISSYQKAVLTRY